MLDEKYRKLASYRAAADALGGSVNLRALRDDIDDAMGEANAVMNELLQDQFAERGIKFEQATWDAGKGDLGKPSKRKVTLADVAAQHPLHWGYVFDDIVQQRGGFDIILANPPWEGFKPQAKEYFSAFSEKISKKKMPIKEYEAEQARLLGSKAVREGWLAYLSRFPHMSEYFRAAADYHYQSAIVGGKRTGSDLNLYKLFTERCFALLRDGGHCGIVIPSGIYKDLGATGLRNMLFDNAQVDSMVSLSNEKFIFEEVHHSFGLLFLNFTKGGRTETLRATFRINPREAITADEFESFVHDESNFVKIDIVTVDAISPETRSVLELRCALDAIIVEKMMCFPSLGQQLAGTWRLRLTNELHMTNDSHLFKTADGPGRLPLFEGKMINQFISNALPPKYWIDESAGRAHMLGASTSETSISNIIDYQKPRLAFREIARATDARTMIAAILPPRVFANHKLMVAQSESIDAVVMLYVLAVINSLTFDFLARMRISASVSMFAFYLLPMPRLPKDNISLKSIAHRSARLACTRQEFDQLSQQAGLRDHRDGATDPAERARLRAELDGLVAHLYGLTEDEFSHILTSFPLVTEPVKQAARNAYRDVERGLIQ